MGQIPDVEKELQKETSLGHPLHGVTCHVVAFNTGDPNEFLFATDSPAAPLAFVHLTWRTESDPNWPYTVCYPGWGEFRTAWLTPDS